MTGRVQLLSNDNNNYDLLEFHETADLFIHYSSLELDGYKKVSEDEIELHQVLKNERGLQSRKIINLKHHL